MVGKIVIGAKCDINASIRTSCLMRRSVTPVILRSELLSLRRGRKHSALHWDMICDLKQGGEIRAAGRVIYRNGRFTIEDTPGRCQTDLD